MNKNVKRIQELAKHELVVFWMQEWDWGGKSGVMTRLKYLDFDAQDREIHNIPYTLKTANSIAVQKVKDDESVKENIGSAERGFGKKQKVHDDHLLALNDKINK